MMSCKHRSCRLVLAWRLITVVDNNQPVDRRPQTQCLAHACCCRPPAMLCWWPQRRKPPRDVHTTLQCGSTIHGLGTNKPFLVCSHQGGYCMGPQGTRAKWYAVWKVHSVWGHIVGSDGQMELCCRDWVPVNRCYRRRNACRPPLHTERDKSLTQFCACVSVYARGGGPPVTFTMQSHHTTLQENQETGYKQMTSGVCLRPRLCRTSCVAARVRGLPWLTQCPARSHRPTHRHRARLRWTHTHQRQQQHAPAWSRPRSPSHAAPCPGPRVRSSRSMSPWSRLGCPGAAVRAAPMAPPAPEHSWESGARRSRTQCCAAQPPHRGHPARPGARPRTLQRLPPRAPPEPRLPPPAA